MALNNRITDPASLGNLIQVQPGAVVSRVLLKQKSGNVTLFAFGKGEELSEHTSPFEALLYVVEGETEVTIGGEGHRLTTGEIITLPPDIPHAVHAVEDFKMLLIMLRG